MNRIAIRQQYPDLKLGMERNHLEEIIFGAYTDRIQEEEIFSDYQYQNDHFFIPSIKDYLEEQDHIEMILDDIAGFELYGCSFDEAVKNVKEENMDIFTEGFYEECRFQKAIFLLDVQTYMNFYNVSFCMDPYNQTYMNFPLKGVW